MTVLGKKYDDNYMYDITQTLNSFLAENSCRTQPCLPFAGALEGVVEVVGPEAVTSLDFGAVEVVGTGSSTSEEELDEDEDLKS